MNGVESLRIAVRSLRANTLRSGLTMLGVIVGVAAVVCVMAVGAGAQADVSETIRTLGANQLLVLPESRNASGARLEAGTTATLTEDDAAAIRGQTPGVQVAAPLLSRSMHLVAGDKNWATLVAGVNADYFVARDWGVGAGRLFGSQELEAGAKVAIVGADIVEALFDGRAGLGETVRIGDVPFTVIGVLDKKGVGAAGRSQDDVVFIPLAAAKSRVLGAVRGATRQALDFIAVKVADATAIPDAASSVEALLRQRHRIQRDAPSDFKVQNPADVLTTRQAAVRTLDVLLIAVASVSLLVGGISIMNIMIVSVTERTREIGLRMAVGARRGDIRMQFLIEALLLALTGGAIGALCGAAAAAFIALEAGWPILISPAAILLACGFAGIVGVGFGLYPAHRAARLDPMAALRFE